MDNSEKQPENSEEASDAKESEKTEPEPMVTESNDAKPTESAEVKTEDKENETKKDSFSLDFITFGKKEESVKTETDESKTEVEETKSEPKVSDSDNDTQDSKPDMKDFSIRLPKITLEPVTKEDSSSQDSTPFTQIMDKDLNSLDNELNDVKKIKITKKSATYQKVLQCGMCAANLENASSALAWDMKSFCDEFCLSKSRDFSKK